MSWSSRRGRNSAPSQQIAVLLLFALNAWLLWRAVTPDVSQEYRAYFIERSTDCLNRTIDGQFMSGTESALTNAADLQGTRHIVRCGFRMPEADGSWTIGNVSRLFFTPTPSGAYRLDLNIADVASNAQSSQQHFEILANGHSLGTESLVQGKQYKLFLLLPSTVFQTEQLDVTLKLFHGSSSRTEPLSVGIKLSGVTLTRMSDSIEKRPSLPAGSDNDFRTHFGTRGAAAPSRTAGRAGRLIRKRHCCEPDRARVQGVRQTTQHRPLRVPDLRRRTSRECAGQAI